MTSTQDEISPGYIRNKRVTISLDETSLIVRAYEPALILIDYSECDPDGIMLPLVFDVQGPSPESYQRREFLNVAPLSISFTPREGGRHQVRIAEVGHNRWFGTLRIDVLGDPIQRREVT
jgi:hypothetical protein